MLGVWIFTMCLCCCFFVLLFSVWLNESYQINVFIRVYLMPADVLTNEQASAWSITSFTVFGLEESCLVFLVVFSMFVWVGWGMLLLNKPWGGQGLSVPSSSGWNVWSYYTYRYILPISIYYTSNSGACPWSNISCVVWLSVFVCLCMCLYVTKCYFLRVTFV